MFYMRNTMKQKAFRIGITLSQNSTEMFEGENMHGKKYNSKDTGRAPSRGKI